MLIGALALRHPMRLPVISTLIFGLKPPFNPWTNFLGASFGASWPDDFKIRANRARFLWRGYGASTEGTDDFRNLTMMGMEILQLIALQTRETKGFGKWHLFMR